MAACSPIAVRTITSTLISRRSRIDKNRLTKLLALLELAGNLLANLTVGKLYILLLAAVFAEEGKEAVLGDVELLLHKP